MQNRVEPGELFIISAPSGAGKTSLIAGILDQHPELALSVSDTTRQPRRGEVDGQHYHFLDHERFRTGIDAGQYLEHAEVYGNFYGTRREQVEALWAAGRNVLLEIDVQGADQVRQTLGNTCAIFIMPPSVQALHSRLTGRGQDSPEAIEGRLQQARNEMQAWARFDYLIVNDDFDQAARELSAIITAWPLRTPRQARVHQELLGQLLEE